MQRKWIVISGGVLSGIGKGIVSASIGRLLNANYKVIPIKCDGYLNVDPGTMNPCEHGEVFVLEDGGEVDMDFGHYERFMNIDCKFSWNLTSGKVFRAVIDKERQGKYLGQTVQIIPHVVDEVMLQYKQIAKQENADICIVEIGGTIGDIENQIFVEAVRQLKREAGPENIVYIHLTYVPELESVGEQKTKPTQQSAALLRQSGISPDIIIGRSKKLLTKKSKHKIALFCNIDEASVISDPDTTTVYELPLIFQKEGLPQIIENKLSLKNTDNMQTWRKLVNRILNPGKQVTVAICGKYTDLHDSYVSIIEALTHAGAHLNCKVNITWIETTEIEENNLEPSELLKGVQGVIIPGGFGSRGAEGKIKVIRYLRENNIPFLGLCFGLQLAVVEFARNVCKLAKANSTEVSPNTPYPVIFIMPEQLNIEEKGATMRLGKQKANLQKGTLVHRMYACETASERHRHRYEVNPLYHAILTSHGLVFSGISQGKKLVEYIELPSHKFFVGTQAHPELKSSLEKPAPLFMGFVKACIKK
ncbi:MAG: CTP synthase (glutamine hydrolyzing) [Candidatus Woesearchaeota archaeon]